MKYVIGIDLGGTKINAAIIDEQGNIFDKISMPSYGGQGKEAVIHQLQQCIFQLHPEKIEGIGIGTPGTVDVLQGQILDVGGNINDWSYCNLKSEMQSFFPDDKFYILNDANAALLGEKWCGAEENYNYFLMLTLGTGIGGAIFQKETGVLLGHHFQGGEFGHVIIVPGGRACSCGQRGCIEKYAAGSAISISYEEKTGLLLTGQEIFSRLEFDEIAKKVVNEFSNYLGLYLVNLQNIFDPEAIVLGGGLIDSKDVWWEKMLNVVKNESNFKNQINIVPGQLKNDAGMIGAGKFVFEQQKKGY